MPRRRLLLPALAALTLTACGTDAPQAAPSPSPSPSGPSLEKVVRTAAAETAALGTSKFTVETTAVTAGKQITVRGEGAYDTRQGTGQLRFDVPGADGTPAGGGSVEQRIIGPDLYLTLPQQPDAFFKLPVTGLGTTSFGSGVDPVASLRALVGLRDVVEVGRKEVQGVETTHYTGTYDVAGALAAVEGQARAVLEAMLRSTDQGVVEFAAYVDGEGRLVRLEQQLELGGSTSLRSVLELYDFGTVVRATPPPADKVRDGAPLLAALRAVLPAPVPAPALPAPAPAPVPPAPAAPAPAPSPTPEA